MRRFLLVIALAVGAGAVGSTLPWSELLGSAGGSPRERPEPWMPQPAAMPATEPASPAPGKPPGGAAAQSFAVLVQTAATQDVPIYLDGLGTVQASALVTVRAQVDGALQEVRFREGQDVHAGDLLALIDPRTYQASLDQTIARKQQDESTLANARLDYGRYRKLAADSFGSVQQSDTAKSAVGQMAAQVAQDQAQIDKARAELSFTRVLAPVDGRTGIRQVDAGNVVHAGDPNGIVVITTLKPIAVVFTLPQQRLAQVTDAMQAGSLEVLALQQGDDGAVLDTGTLAVLDNQVDQATGTIRLKATFPNAKLRLWPGGFVTVRLKIGVKRDATTVPPLALQRGPGGAYVYVLQDDCTVIRRPVTVGHQDQYTAIIETGVAPGERLVTDGASRLADGARVSVVEPATGFTAADHPRPPGKT